MMKLWLRKNSFDGFVKISKCELRTGNSNIQTNARLLLPDSQIIQDYRTKLLVKYPRLWFIGFKKLPKTASSNLSKSSSLRKKQIQDVTEHIASPVLRKHKDWYRKQCNLVLRMCKYQITLFLLSAYSLSASMIVGPKLVCLSADRVNCPCQEIITVFIIKVLSSNCGFQTEEKIVVMS